MVTNDGWKARTPKSTKKASGPSAESIDLLLRNKGTPTGHTATSSTGGGGPQTTPSTNTTSHEVLPRGVPKRTAEGDRAKANKSLNAKLGVSDSESSTDDHSDQYDGSTEDEESEEETK